MSFLFLRRLCRRAHRLSAALRLRRVRLFRSARRETAYASDEWEGNMNAWGPLAASMPFRRPTRGLYESHYSAGGLSMYRLLVKLAMIIMFGGLLYSIPVAAQVSPTTKRAAS